jgi:hypothetical protein
MVREGRAALRDPERGGPLRAANSVVINAPIDVVWEVLYDVEATIHWQPDLKAATCLERDEDGRPLVVHMVLDTIVRRTEATLKVIHSDIGVMRWEKLSGDVPDFVGSWTLARRGRQRTSAEYRLTIDFGRLGKLVRGPFASALEGAAGSSMPTKLKAYVESLAGVPARHAGAVSRGVRR